MTNIWIVLPGKFFMYYFDVFVCVTAKYKYVQEYVTQKQISKILRSSVVKRTKLIETTNR